MINEDRIFYRKQCWIIKDVNQLKAFLLDYKFKNIDISELDTLAVELNCVSNFCDKERNINCIFDGFPCIIIQDNVLEDLQTFDIISERDFEQSDNYKISSQMLHRKQTVQSTIEQKDCYITKLRCDNLKDLKFKITEDGKEILKKSLEHWKLYEDALKSVMIEGLCDLDSSDFYKNENLKTEQRFDSLIKKQNL